MEIKLKLIEYLLRNCVDNKIINIAISRTEPNSIIKIYSILMSKFKLDDCYLKGNMIEYKSLLTIFLCELYYNKMNPYLSIINCVEQILELFGNYFEIYKKQKYSTINKIKSKTETKKIIEKYLKLIHNSSQINIFAKILDSILPTVINNIIYDYLELPKSPQFIKIIK